MPIRLEDLTKESKQVTFEHLGEQVTISYRLNALTPMQGDLIARMSEMFKSNAKPITLAEENGMNSELIDALLWLLVEWDVLGENGKPLPITRKWLSRLPSSFLYTLFGEILADMRPNARSAAISSAS